MAEMDLTVCNATIMVTGKKEMYNLQMAWPSKVKRMYSLQQQNIQFQWKIEIATVVLTLSINCHNNLQSWSAKGTARLS